MAPRNKVRRSRPTCSTGRRHGSLAMESLESRLALAGVSSGDDGAGQPLDVRLGAPVDQFAWNGQQTKAFRDRYVVQMPSAKVRAPEGYIEYVSTAPQIEDGWSIRSIGMGFYSLVTPGASVEYVSAWASGSGAVSVEPDHVLVKQATPNEPRLPTASPGDPTYGRFQWGLNNTGVLPNTVSPESQAAAELGNGPDIFPRVRDADIDAPEAWYLQTGTTQVIVAVFDDGIDDSHPDLAQNMWNRDVANRSLPAGNQIPAFNSNGTPFVGRHGFNSAEYLADNQFYEGSPVAPYNDPGFVSTRPGDIRLIELDPNDGSQIVSWRGANNSHGTHVAGIVGARGNNGTGGVGVNWAVSLYSANIFRYGDYDDGGLWVNETQSGSMTAFVDAVGRIQRLKSQYDQNFVVANLSFNTYSRSPLMLQALQILSAPVEDGGCDMLIVAAAGNGYDPCLLDGVGDLLGGPECNDVMTYPAGFKDQIPNMIVVTASNAQDELTRFANWSPTVVDIAAPGENIWSTIPLSARRFQLAVDPEQRNVPVQYDSFEPFWRPQGDPPSPPPPSGGGVTFIPQDLISRPHMYREVPRAMQEFSPGSPAASGGAYASMSGTSMSTAYVSGAAALMAAEFYRWTESVPSAAFLRQGILTQADVVPELIYLEGTNDPPFDYQHAPTVGTARVPVARTGMYETPTDPHTRTHRIAGDRRLNLYKSVFWVKNNLPPSISIIDRPETAADRGESRLEGDAGITPFRYSVVFTGGLPTVPITVRIWTQDLANRTNAATAGSDYIPIAQATPAVFTIPVLPAGTTRWDIPDSAFTVSVIGDTVAESNETFQMQVRTARNSQSVWTRSRLVASTIIDDDPTNAKPFVRVTQAPTTITEGNGGTRKPTQAFVTLGLDRPALRTVIVPYTIRQGASSGAEATSGVDFLGTAMSARIAAGQTSVRVPVYVVGDTRDESNEQFQFVLGTPNLGVKKRGSSSAIMTIVDDDTTVAPPPSTDPTVLLSGPSGPVVEGSNAVFGVTLSDPVRAGWAVAVYYSVLGGTAKVGSDIAGRATGVVVIPAGGSSATITVATLRDRLVEANEQFSVQLTRAVFYRVGSNEKRNLAFLGTPIAQATIVDAMAMAMGASQAATPSVVLPKPLNPRP